MLDPSAKQMARGYVINPISQNPCNVALQRRDRSFHRDAALIEMERVNVVDGRQLGLALI